MRSTFAGLNTMVRGINANRLSLDTVGHNITNASTTGYSRQSVDLSATNAQEVYSVYGQQLVGTGVDSLSITRARNVYADKQYWKENGDNSYYAALKTNYTKVESIFNDSDNTGIENALENFYKSWVDVSTSASTATTRKTVVDAGQTFADRIQTAAKQMQQQISANYEDLNLNVSKVNDLTDQIVALNKNISSLEATGSNANDLRDQRDTLVDKLSGYMQVNVYEEANGMYTIVSNGATMVGGINKLNLELKDNGSNSTYGTTDYTLQLKETGTAFDPMSGTLAAEQKAVADDKGYIDTLANISAFMMTTFNTQHKAGYGISGSKVDQTKHDVNFYGDSSTTYAWDKTNQAVTATPTTGTATSLKGIQIINALNVSSQLTQTDGENYLAVCGTTKTTTTTDTAEADQAATTVTATDGTKTTTTIASGKKTVTVEKINGTADGSNAVLLSALFNSTKDNTVDTTSDRAIGDVSLNNYYNKEMTSLGSLSSAMNSKVSAQEDIMTQVENWRSSTSGVNWNEELTNMIKFQQGFSACSRCLTTMDEMLDKLVNSTGMVGR